MKKKLIVAGLAFVMVSAASAQKDVVLPKPPKPPKPPVEHVKEIPPPPPAPEAPEPPAPPDAPPPPPAPPMPTTQMENHYEAFLKRNTSIKSVGWTNNNEIVIRLKSGKEEKYNLDDGRSIKVAEAKYGELPVAPPAPPPPLPPGHQQ